VEAARLGVIARRERISPSEVLRRAAHIPVPKPEPTPGVGGGPKPQTAAPSVPQKEP
jgi:hypothetical protein